MRAAVIAAFVIAASLVSPASAEKPGLTDFSCGFTSFRDPRPESSYDAQIAFIDGGPVFQSGTLTCTVKVGASTHAAPYVHGATVSATGEGVTVIPAAVRTFIQSAYEVYLCDEFTDAAGVTWYWDDVVSDWTNDPGGPCRLAIGQTTESPIDYPKVLRVLFNDVVDPIVCPVLATLATVSQPPLDIRADGDIYVADDLLMDCPPYAGPDENVWFDRLELGALPPRTNGVIRVSDTGDGPEWEVSGTLVSVDWDCAADGAGVVCDWSGYLSRPRCTEINAVAGVLAADARVRTRVSCDWALGPQSATTAVAGEVLPVAYAERGTNMYVVESVRCVPDDGAGGPPVAPYVTTCGFTF